MEGSKYPSTLTKVVAFIPVLWLQKQSNDINGEQEEERMKIAHDLKRFFSQRTILISCKPFYCFQYQNNQERNKPVQRISRGLKGFEWQNVITLQLNLRYRFNKILLSIFLKIYRNSWLFISFLSWIWNDSLGFYVNASNFKLYILLQGFIKYKSIWKLPQLKEYMYKHNYTMILKLKRNNSRTWSHIHGICVK